MGRFSNALKQIESQAPLKLTLAASSSTANASSVQNERPQTISFSRAKSVERPVEEKPKREPKQPAPTTISLSEFASDKPRTSASKKAKSCSPFELGAKPNIEIATPIAAPSSKITLATSSTVHSSVGPAFVAKTAPSISSNSAVAKNCETTTFVTFGISVPSAQSKPNARKAEPTAAQEKREEAAKAPPPSPAPPCVNTSAQSPRPTPATDQPAAEHYIETISQPTISDYSNSVTHAVEEKIEVIDSAMQALTGGASVFDEIASYLAAQNRDRLPATLFFTSASPNEGATRMIIPLAESLSRILSVETLLIDANIRRPDLTRRWGLFDEDEVRGFWSGEVNWRNCIRRSNQSSVHLLPSATSSNKKSTGVSLEAVRRALKEMKSRYRLILLDGADLTNEETAPLASLCDSTYLAIRLGRSTRRTVIEARDALEASNANLRGCVVLGDE